jgi:hypothetical protein
LIPADLAPKGFTQPPGKITISRVDDGVEIADSLRRSPGDLGMRDLAELGGPGTYWIMLWDAAHRRVLLKRKMLVSQGERRPWPPPLPTDRRAAAGAMQQPRMAGGGGHPAPGTISLNGVEVDLSGLTGGGGIVGLIAALAPSIIGYLDKKSAAEEARAAYERQRLEELQAKITEQSNRLQNDHVTLIRDVLAQQVESNNANNQAMAQLLAQARDVDGGASGGSEATGRMLAMIERLNSRIDSMANQRNGSLAEVEQALHLIEQVKSQARAAGMGGPGPSDGGGGVPGFDVGMIMQNLDKVATALKIMFGPTPTGPGAPAPLPAPVGVGSPFPTG